MNKNTTKYDIKETEYVAASEVVAGIDEINFVDHLQIIGWPAICFTYLCVHAFIMSLSILMGYETEIIM